MCGIFGVISPFKTGFYADEMQFIRNAMLAGSVRGEDGTGLYYINGKNPEEVSYLKKANNPYWLLTDKKYPAFEKSLMESAQVVVGHNRFATKGNLTDLNTHPFQQGPITMVHNGTIHSGLTYGKNVEVDSHALTIALANEGIKIFSKITGAFACVWHDARDGSLNIAKNMERPLAMVKSRSTYFFASEAGMLCWLVARTQKSYDMKEFKIENNKIYKFKLATLGEPEVIPLPEKKTYLPTNYTKNNGSTTKAPPKTQEKTLDKEEEVYFQIMRKRVEKAGDIDLWTYFCRSVDGEAAYFKSKDDYPVGQTWYSAMIQTVDIGQFPEIWGEYIPWYRIKTKTVVSLEQTPKAQHKEQDCVSCNTPIPKEQEKACTSMQVSKNKWKLLCHSCTQQFSFGLQTYVQ